MRRITSLFRSLRFQMTFFSTLFMVVVLFLVEFYALNTIKKDIAEQVAHDLVTDSVVLRDTVGYAIEYEDFSLIGQLFDDLQFDNRYAYLEAIRKDGRTVYRSGIAPDDIPAYGVDAARSPDLILSHIEQPDRPFLFEIDLERFGVDVGVLKVQLDLSGYSEKLAAERTHLSIVTMLFAFFSALLMVMLMQRLSRPLAELHKLAADVAAGQNGRRLGKQPSEELDAVADSLNHMLDNLQQRESLLSSTLDSIGDALLLTDTRGDLIGMNPVAEQMTGYSKQDVLGKPLDEIVKLVNSVTQETITSSLGDVLETGTPQRYSRNIQLQGNNGQTSQVISNARPIYDDAGDLRGGLVVLQNVTESHSLRRVIKQQGEQLQSILDDMQIWIAGLDTQGRVLFINNTALEQTGSEESAVVGRTLWNGPVYATVEGVSGKVQSMFAQAMAGLPAREDIQVRSLEGVEWVDFGMHPVRNDAGKITMVIAEGTLVTRRHRAERRERVRSHILSMIADGMALPAIQTSLALGIEAELGGYHCAVMVWDEVSQQLTLAAAPTVSTVVADAFAEPVPAAASVVAEAVFSNRRTIVENINAGQGESGGLLYRSGYAACLAEPIRGVADNVLGVFVVLSPKPDDFSALDIELIERGASLASMAIEHARLSENLRHEREFIRAVLENVSEGIVACNQSGVLTLFNHETRRLHGLERQELPPEEWAQYYSLYHADGETLMEMDEVPLFRALNGEYVRGAELVIKPHDAEPHYIVSNGQQLLDDKGKVIGAVVSMRDLTQAKKLAAHDSRQARLLESINDAQSRFLGAIERDKGFDRLLSNILTLTDSEYGFIGEVLHTPTGAPYLKTYAITNIAWDDATRAFYDKHAPSGMEFFNLNSLFGAALVTKEVVISNDPANDERAGGLPHGHPDLNAFLGVPVISDGEMIAMVGIANRSSGYDQQVVDFLQPLLSTIGQLVEANHLQVRLVENEERLRNSQRFANVGSWEWTINSGALYWSEPVSTMYGFPAEEMHTELDTFYKALHPEDREKVENATRECFKGGEYCVEHRVVWEDGTVRWLEQKGDVIRGEDGRAVTMLGLTRDITEQKNLQAELEKQKRTHEDIVNSMLDAVITIDGRGTISSFNPAAEALFGYSVKEVLGTNVSRLMPAEHAAHHDRYLSNYAKTGQAKILGIGGGRELEGQRKDGTVFPMWLSVSEISKAGDGKRTFVGTCHDLSLQKEQELKLHRTQKMDALGKLTGGIAHDYNNMLGVILGYAQMLEMKVDEQSDLGRYVKRIVEAAERSRDLTAKLLDFSRFQKAKAEVVNICDVLEHSRPLMEKTLTPSPLHVICGEHRCRVRINRGELEDALLNLVINARHAMPDGGEVTITIDTVEIDLPLARLLELPEGQYVKTSVIDTGSGMSQETQAKIFDPFFTTKGNEGTGLGLSQVYGFIQRSHGGIRVYSEPGHGTRFDIYLPLEVDEETIAEISSSVGEEALPAGRQEVILVVDDEASLRNLAADILEEGDYLVLKAEDGVDALKVLGDSNVDLVLSDILMPNMDGYELLKKVNELYPGLPVQLTSGFADRKNVNPDIPVLLKPYDIKTLLGRVQELLRGRERG